MYSEFLQFAPYLLAGYVAFLMGILSPGPNVLAIVGTSMGTSRKAGVVMACGISSGSFIWAILAVLGFTAVLATYYWFATILRIVGGLYLIWLGINYFKAARAGAELKVSKRKVTSSSKKLYFQGLAIQLTNPKAALYWVSVMSLVLQPNAPQWVAIAMIVGIGIISFTGHISWALLFSTKRVVSFYQSFKKYIDAMLGTFFTLLGAGLIASLFENGDVLDEGTVPDIDQGMRDTSIVGQAEPSTFNHLMTQFRKDL